LIWHKQGQGFEFSQSLAPGHRMHLSFRRTPRSRYTYTRRYGVTSQKAVVFIITFLKTPKSHIVCAQ